MSDLRKERLDAYNARKQAQFEKTIGRAPKRLKVKSGFYYKVLVDYRISFSPEADRELANLKERYRLSPMLMWIAISAAIIKAGHSRQEFILQKIFYAKDIKYFAHYFASQMNKVYVHETNHLGREIVEFMKQEALENAHKKALRVQFC